MATYGRLGAGRKNRGLATSSEESVSDLIAALKQHASQEAAQEIYQRYIGRPVRRAKSLLGDAPRGAADEEDIAALAINGLFAGIQEGRFPRLDDRQDLWQVLMRLVRCRVIDHLRKYGPEATLLQGESVLNGSLEDNSQPRGMAGAHDNEPTPDEVLEFADSLRRRLAELPAERHRRIALWKLEGRTSEEIAQLLGSTTRTVQYALHAIREAWEAA